MVTGARTAGSVSGPAGQPPRLFTEVAVADRATGLIFVPAGYDTISLRSDPADVTGIVTATFGPVPGDQVVLVERITVASDSTAPTAVTVYLGSVDAGNVVDSTGEGNSAVADEVQPILVPSGQMLIFRWVGVTTGKRGFGRIQYRFGQYQQAQV